VRPLPLRLQAQVRTGLLEGHLQTPSLHHVPQDLRRQESLLGAEVRRVRLLALGIAGQDVADRDRVLTAPMPQPGPGEDPHRLAVAAVPVHLDILPGRVAPLGPLGQATLPPPLLRLGTTLARWLRSRRLRERRV